MKYWINESLREAGWAPITILLLSFIIGKLFNGYIIFPWLDKLFHVAGGIAITYFFCVSIAHFQKLAGPVMPSQRLTLPLVLTILTAIGWEILELIGDRLLQTKMNFGLTDTLLDIFFGVLGGLALLLIRTQSVELT